MSEPPIDLRALRVGIVLNRSSGSCDAGSEARLEALLRQAQITPVAIHCVDGSDLDATLDRITGAGIEILIVLGGDGTIRAAAERCGAAGILLIPLPGGTMNMLPKALYGGRNWAEALAATLADPQILVVGAGAVGTSRFFCAAIFGAPSLWAEAREAVRVHDFRTAAERACHAFHRMFSQKVRYRFGAGESGAAVAVAIVCPLISSALPSHETALEAAALDPADAREGFRLGWNALFSDWRIDASVRRSVTRQALITSRGAIPAILDGEKVRLPSRAEIRFVPRGFCALVPAASAAPAISSVSGGDPARN